MGLHGYIDKQLVEDEDILYRAHLSWIPVILHIIPFAIIGSAVSGLLWSLFGLGIAILGLLLFILIGFISQTGRIIRNLSVDIVVTNQRIHSKEGLINVKNDREASLSRVDDSDIDFHSIWNRLFKFGDLEVRTIGGEAFFKFQDISRPRLLKRAINEAKDTYAAWGMTNNNSRNGVRDIDYNPRNTDNSDNRRRASNRKKNSSSSRDTDRNKRTRSNSNRQNQNRTKDSSSTSANRKQKNRR